MSFIKLNVGLAKDLGLNKALVLSRIYYYQKLNQSQNKNFKDGSYWVYQSVEKFREKDFPFWSIRTIKELLKELELYNYISSVNLFSEFSRVKSYSVNQSVIEKYFSNTVSDNQGYIDSKKVQNQHLSKCKNVTFDDEKSALLKKRIIKKDKLKNNNIYTKVHIVHPNNIYKGMDFGRTIDYKNIFEKFKKNTKLAVTHFNNEYYTTILETVEDYLKKGRRLKVDGYYYSVDEVAERLLKLDSTHLEYVIDVLHRNKGINNPGAYTMTCLFNALVRKTIYVSAQVNRDSENSLFAKVEGLEDE